ncbi:MAG: LytTR family DNA-binding domain-containing protein [Lachnospiraceae bacterium]|nr:LytTR family DNA-binding domain-containing protein [Lachnospiraceae bacterium]
MRIKLILEPKYEEPEIHICGRERNEELKELYETVNAAVNVEIAGYNEHEIYRLLTNEIIRIYTQNKKVYAVTARGIFELHNRLYEMEQLLGEKNFLRISNSELVNIRKIRRLDTSLTGTIRMFLANENETYVSRRYVTKIKQALG